jgi:hypothetical protein
MQQERRATRIELWTQLRQYFTFAEFKKGIALRLSYIILQAADYLMTIFAANAGFDEMNPVMRGLLGSPIEMLAFKLLIPLAIATFVPAKLLIPALILLLAIIGLNIKELLVFVM